MADIKSAFILAFATLGYEWAASNGLKPIRRAIRSGDLPDNGTAAVVRLAGSPGENSVIQFSGSKRGVAVVGHDGHTVLLPGPGTGWAPVLDGTATKVKAWPWPITTGPHLNVWEARESGNLFHADFCNKHGW